MAGVLATNHVLYDTLDSGKDCLVVAEGENVRDLGVQQGVNDWEHLAQVEVIRDVPGEEDAIVQGVQKKPLAFLGKQT